MLRRAGWPLSASYDKTQPVQLFQDEPEDNPLGGDVLPATVRRFKVCRPFALGSVLVQVSDSQITCFG